MLFIIQSILFICNPQGSEIGQLLHLVCSFMAVIAQLFSLLVFNTKTFMVTYPKIIKKNESWQSKIYLVSELLLVYALKATILSETFSSFIFLAEFQKYLAKIAHKLPWSSQYENKGIFFFDWWPKCSPRMWLMQLQSSGGRPLRLVLIFSEFWIIHQQSLLLLLEIFNLNNQNPAVNHLLPLELRPFCTGISDGIETIKLLCVMHAINNI